MCRIDVKVAVSLLSLQPNRPRARQGPPFKVLIGSQLSPLKRATECCQWLSTLSISWRFSCWCGNMRLVLFPLLRLCGFLSEAKCEIVWCWWELDPLRWQRLHCVLSYSLYVTFWTTLNLVLSDEFSKIVATVNKLWSLVQTLSSGLVLHCFI